MLLIVLSLPEERVAVKCARLRPFEGDFMPGSDSVTMGVNLIACDGFFFFLLLCVLVGVVNYTGALYSTYF